MTCIAYVVSDDGILIPLRAFQVVASGLYDLGTALAEMDARMLDNEGTG